jgi:hypothetical protein
LPPLTVSLKTILAADTAPPPLSLFLPLPRGTPEPTPTPISLSALSARSLIWRRCRCLTPLCVHARARAPLLLHRLRDHIAGCRHRRTPPLWFPSERHRLRRFTVRPFHPPLLSPFEAALTFPLPHRHYRVVPPSPPATGAPSLPTKASDRSILHHLHAALPLG